WGHIEFRMIRGAVGAGLVPARGRPQGPPLPGWGHIEFRMIRGTVWAGLVPARRSDRVTSRLQYIKN
ncbi:hypothetical protein HMPREF0372_03755, partial [Flavonifractor plautii ATCC 29863]